MPLVPQDLATARLYASIKTRLRSAGRPIPENDLWIAALALQHQLILATRDGHFEALEDLSLEAWWLQPSEPSAGLACPS